MSPKSSINPFQANGQFRVWWGTPKKLCQKRSAQTLIRFVTACSIQLDCVTTTRGAGGSRLSFDNKYDISVN